MSRLLNFTSLPATIWLNRIWLFLTGYRACVSGVVCRASHRARYPACLFFWQGLPRVPSSVTPGIARMQSIGLHQLIGPQRAEAHLWTARLRIAS